MQFGEHPSILLMFLYFVVLAEFVKRVMTKYGSV
jgi:hypothetical protein